MATKYATWSEYLPQGVTIDHIHVYAAGFLVFVATVIFGRSITNKNPTRMKARELMERRAELKGEYVNTKRKRKEPGKAEENIAFKQMVVKKLNMLHENKIKDVAKLLNAAGFRNKNAVIRYAFSQVLFAVVLFLVGLTLFRYQPDHMARTIFKAILPFAMGFLGYKLPYIMAANARGKRFLQIRRGLPDALDLMMICTEAGLTLSAALDRVSKEIGEAYPELADELSITSIEIGFLPERRKALENLAERLDMPEVRALTSIMIQTEKYGTPVSQALRVLSKEFRTQRMLMAEQKAARLPAIMTVPMIMFILPTLFIVVISPAIIKLMMET